VSPGSASYTDHDARGEILILPAPPNDAATMHLELLQVAGAASVIGDIRLRD
jgi:hypothetical protein